MTRVVTGQLDAYIEPGPRIVADVPGMREAFEDLGGGAVLNNSPYDLAAVALICARGRRGRDRRLRRAARPAAAARLGRRVPDLLRRRPRTRSSTRRSASASSGAWRRLASSSSHGRFPRPMLQEVALGQKSLADYTHLVGRELVESIRELAGPLEGKRVLHVSATAFGGGVSEILYTIVPLMRDVGLDAHWNVILGPRGVLQRHQAHAQLAPGRSRGDLPRAVGAVRALQLDERPEPPEDAWDVIIVHDPQPVGLRHNAPGGGEEVDLALPHRPLDAERDDARADQAADRGVRRIGLAPASSTSPTGSPRRPTDRST